MPHGLVFIGAVLVVIVGILIFVSECAFRVPAKRNGEILHTTQGGD